MNRYTCSSVITMKLQHVPDPRSGAHPSTDSAVNSADLGKKENLKDRDLSRGKIVPAINGPEIRDVPRKQRGWFLISNFAELLKACCSLIFLCCARF